MDNWDRKYQGSFLAGIKRIWESKSPERADTKKREPHTIPTPFLLEFPHTHQDAKGAIKSPAICLACARAKKEGEPGELMRIKTDEDGQKGDQRVVVICKCANPSQKDNNRYAFAQEIIEGQKPTIPDESCLVSSRIIFLSQTIQPEDKETFLLNVTHPAINQSTPSELKKSAAHALLVITEDLKSTNMLLKLIRNSLMNTLPAPQHMRKL